MSYQRASVLTVTYNNAKTVTSYLDGLTAQHGAVAEVVVVDNGSSDNTIAELRRHAPGLTFPVRVVESTNTGFSAGMNRAAAARQRADLPILCLNPDLELGEGVLGDALDVLNRNSHAGIVTAPLVDETGEPDTASIRSLPTVNGSVVYSVLGRFAPGRLRYNARRYPGEIGETPNAESFAIEATTGAFMLLNPQFRSAGAIFDPDYWMYGEDLQLCSDARAEGFTVLMTRTRPSVHLKGESSGRPRRLRSNWAFHRALFLYYRKNLNRQPILLPVFSAAVLGRFAMSAASSAVVRGARKLPRTTARRDTPPAPESV